MNVTLDEAIRIYARASRAWFGPRAVKRTQDRIDMLCKAGISTRSPGLGAG